MRVVFAGDSYITKFQVAMNTPTNNIPQDLDIGHVDITYIGKGCGQVNTFRSQDMMREIAAVRPHIMILLQLGGNYISLTERNGVRTANRLFTLAEDLMRFAEADYVYICGLIHRQRSHYIRTHTEKIHYNQQVDNVNNNLTRLSSRHNRIKFWKHKGFTNPRMSVRHSDGTHLNTHGLYNYRQSIRGSIVRADNDFSRL